MGRTVPLDLRRNCVAVVTQQEVRVHAVDEGASQEGPGDVAPGAADEDVRNVADVLFHIHSQVLERGAEDRDAHSLEKQACVSFPTVNPGS